MAIRQYYYTSYTNTTTGDAGFQVKALSPDIPSELQRTIMRLLAYRVPPTCDIRALATHPIALRYYYVAPQECILLCCQSTGNDDHGRPGNFFAHVVILEKSLLSSIPPIFFWRSPFWRKEDAAERLQLESLEQSEQFEEEPTLDLEDIWSFLDQGENRVLLYQLLCAVIQSARTKKRILILDSTENVVLWIAAVSCLLPPECRPLLTFSTYHHDPQRGAYLITGAINSNAIRTTPEIQQAYFILNTDEGTASPVDPSPYARLAVSASFADGYETELLPIFADFHDRFPTPIEIDEQLDQLALYADLQQEKTRSGALTTPEIVALSGALTSFEQQSSFQEQERHELYRIEQLVRRSGHTAMTAMTHALEHRIHLLFQKHALPQDAILSDELQEFTHRYLLQKQVVPQTVIQVISPYASPEQIQQGIDSASYLHWLNSQLEKATIEQFQRTWKYIGAYTRPGHHSWNLTIASFQIITEIAPKDKEASNLLLHEMATAMQPLGHEWLQFAMTRYQTLDPINKERLHELYQSISSAATAEQRIVYQKIVADNLESTPS